MNVRVRVRILFILAVSLSLSTIACLHDQTLSEPKSADAVDRKLSRFAFIEEGRLAALIISTQATIRREGEKYMPLEIAIANKRAGELSIGRESFTLIDEKGNRYPVAEPRELIESYPHLDQDRQRFSELFPLISTRFSAFNQISSKLLPTRAGRPVQDLTSLPNSGVMVDFLYFPMPSTGLAGHRFELFLDTPELENPLFVSFVVP